LITEVETPALAVDLDAFEENLRTMKASLAQYPKCKVRPHFKAHKSVWLAKAQAKELRCEGFCCQKVSEAEALLRGGILDVYLSNEVVDPVKLRRVMALAKQVSGKLTFCADSVEGVGAIEEAAASTGLTQVACLTDCNVGQDRCGATGPQETLAVSLAIAKSPHLVFKGIQVYQGGAQHIRAFTDREGSSKSVAAKASELVRLLEANGLKVEVVTGGGTGTYAQDAATGVFTEVGLSFQCSNENYI